MQRACAKIRGHLALIVRFCPMNIPFFARGFKQSLIAYHSVAILERKPVITDTAHTMIIFKREVETGYSFYCLGPFEIEFYRDNVINIRGVKLVSYVQSDIRVRIILITIQDISSVL